MREYRKPEVTNIAETAGGRVVPLAVGLAMVGGYAIAKAVKNAMDAHRIFSSDLSVPECVME